MDSVEVLPMVTYVFVTAELLRHRELQAVSWAAEMKTKSSVAAVR
jgi:hypothetical protein